MVPPEDTRPRCATVLVPPGTFRETARKTSSARARDSEFLVCVCFLEKPDASLVHTGYPSDGYVALMSAPLFFFLIENHDENDNNENPVFMSLPAPPALRLVYR